jgi:hypothetical protein
MRDLIKQESLAKFDLDYDVLVQMILDREVEPGKTVLNVLEDHSAGLDVRRVLNKFPLLTIYVPDLKGFSAEIWNTDESVPSVAIAYSAVNGKIPVIDPDLNTTTISIKDEPNFPVVVLKEHERLRIVAGPGVNARKARVAFRNSNFAYYFFNQDIDQLKASRLVWWQNLDAKVRASYLKSTNCANCYQRDYIWYNISLKDGVTEGPFDPNYTEAITGLTFESNSVLQTVTGDWTEGTLEFHFTIMFIGGTGGISTLEKVYFASANAFSGDLHEAFSTPVQIVPWRMNEYGDKWKIRISEFDPGTTTTIVSSSTSTFGTNFKADVSGNLFGIKFDAGVGGSATWSQTNSTTIATTNESNQLGETILAWYDPVVTSRGTAPVYAVWTTKEISTGAVKISIEPIRIN